MSNTPVKRSNEHGILFLDRRAFLTAGMVAAASMMIPSIAFSAPAKQLRTIPRRKLGALL
ncbi:hypothetical protein GSUET_15150 [Geobacter sulfurreducens subsp. ethanolicus]|uniref:hypothetical protein n=1 Tax=Geobacter sulfurreducens TaxID=35554 RepID=UPI002572C8B2|nr:hypothetical protein [Geobacter sulfurreducens]BEH09903.1 hypothetical protein GSUET_15150 [Geobacter sulfurreducens subsp. ethanolicus]